MTRRDTKRHRAARWVATLLTLALFGALAVWVWVRSDPGPAVKMGLMKPGLHTVLPLHRTVALQGRVVKGRDVRCNGRPVSPVAGGRFRLEVPGPKEPGLFTIECHAENEKGRKFVFRFGRLAGHRAPLTAPVKNAFRLKIPLRRLGRHGVLLAPLRAIIQKELTAQINEVGQKLSFRVGPVAFNGVSVKRAGLVEVKARGKGALDLTLEMKGFCLRGSLSGKGLSAPLAKLSSSLGSLRSLCLPVGLRFHVVLSKSGTAPPEVKVGPLSTSTLDKLGAMRAFARTSAFQNALTAPIQAALTWAGAGAQSLAAKLREVFGVIDDQLTKMARLLPPAPTALSKKRPRVCIGVYLTRMETLPSENVLLVEADANIQGYTLHGAPCRGDAVTPFPEEDWRVANDAVPAGAGFPRGRPVVGVSLELFNAYLWALWRAGNLMGRGKGRTQAAEIPVSLEEAKRNGFDIRSARLLLPPLLSPAGKEGAGSDRFSERLTLSMVESEILLATQGEPRRLFRFNGRVPLELSLTYENRVKLVFDRDRPLVLGLRCVGESGGRPCTRQSRRYESLAKTAVELVKSGKVDLPQVMLTKLRPLLRTDTHTVTFRRPGLYGRFLTAEVKVSRRRSGPVGPLPRVPNPWGP